MRRFLSSARYPLLTCAVLAGVTTAAYILLKPQGDGVGNFEIVRAFTIAGWAVGPTIGLLSFFGIGILNLLRRLLRIRKVAPLNPVVVIIGVQPWFLYSWILLDEPRYTAFARAAIDFVGRPMLWGSLVATLFALLLGLSLLLPTKK